MYAVADHQSVIICNHLQSCNSDQIVRQFRCWKRCDVIQFSVEPPKLCIFLLLDIWDPAYICIILVQITWWRTAVEAAGCWSRWATNYAPPTCWWGSSRREHILVYMKYTSFLRAFSHLKHVHTACFLAQHRPKKVSSTQGMWQLQDP